MTIDYLTEDKLLPNDQKFVCISFLTNSKDTTLIGVKIRGVFSTYDDACTFAKKVQTVDPAFNVFVGDMGKWLSFDPNPDSIKNNEYENEKLNSMMKAYMENQEHAKILHEKRKNEMMKENIVENLKNRTEYLNSLKIELSSTKDEDTNKKENIQLSIDSIETQLKEMVSSKEDLDKQIEDLTNQIKVYLETVNENSNINIIKDIKNINSEDIENKDSESTEIKDTEIKDTESTETIKNTETKDTKDI